MKKEKKPKVIYYEDRGQTIYSMAALDGKTPEEREEEEKRRKNFIMPTAKELWAMTSAAFTVYGPLLLIIVGSFSVAALLLYLFLH